MLNAVYQHLLVSAAFPSVEVAEEINAIVGRATAAIDGTVFVVPVREKARPPRYATGGHTQTVDIQFATAILFREHGDPRGAGRALAFDARKAAVEQQLVGWQVDTGGDICALVSGDSTHLGNGVSIYIQLWQTTRYLIGALQ